MEKSLQDRIDYLISIKAVPSGFTPEQPDPSFPYSGDLYSARTLTLLKKIECSLLSEIEEWLEANNHSGRFYLYPENKRAAQGIKIILELEPSEKETPHQETSSENISIKVVKLELKNEFLEKENKNLSETVQKLNNDLLEARNKSNDFNLSAQLMEMYKIQAVSVGQSAGADLLMKSFEKGQSAGDKSSQRTIELLESRIKQLEEEKAKLISDHVAEIEELEAELDEYREKVGELPKSDDEGMETKLAKMAIDLIDKKFMTSPEKPTLPAKPGKPAPAQIPPEEKLIHVVASMLMGQTAIETGAEQLANLAKQVGGMIELGIKNMTPVKVAGMVFDMMVEKKAFSIMPVPDDKKTKILGDLKIIVTEVQKRLK